MPMPIAPLTLLHEAEEPRVAGMDDDGEAILVEEDPQPHEIAEDPAMRCRYPSKHCLRRRTVKKTGALHSMCAFHRAKANRNQRRLEKRKRMQKEHERATKRQAVVKSKTPRVVAIAVDASPRGVSFDFDALEPFRAPVPLFKEDLDELRALVDAAVSVDVHWPTA